MMRLLSTRLVATAAAVVTCVGLLAGCGKEPRRPAPHYWADVCQLVSGSNVKVATGYAPTDEYEQSGTPGRHLSCIYQADWRTPKLDFTAWYPDASDFDPSPKCVDIDIPDTVASICSYPDRRKEPDGVLSSSVYGTMQFDGILIYVSVIPVTKKSPSLKRQARGVELVMRELRPKIRVSDFSENSRYAVK